jgi:hypothetical protein
VFRREGGRWVIVQEHLSDAPAAGDAAPPAGTAADAAADTAHASHAAP